MRSQHSSSNSLLYNSPQLPLLLPLPGQFFSLLSRCHIAPARENLKTQQFTLLSMAGSTGKGWISLAQASSVGPAIYFPWLGWISLFQLPSVWLALLDPALLGLVGSPHPSFHQPGYSILLHWNPAPLAGCCYQY